ncbi:cytochrome P450 [Streptomyces sp. NPDC053474]|uniref:cytochrome P450 n=1 Tax=Streptomyces sp. NPDC053474 TaxID=3365704 RepID=UPI0037D004E9
MTAAAPAQRSLHTLPLRYPFALGPHGTPPQALEWARTHHPVCPVLLPSGGTAWMVTRKDDIRAVLTDRRFSRAVGHQQAPRLVEGDLSCLPGGIFNLDGPEHTRIRRIVSGYFSRAQVDSWRPLVERHTIALLDSLTATARTGDLVAAFTAPLPALISCDILGVPHELRAAYQSSFSTAADLTAGTTAVTGATRRLLELADRVIAHSRRFPAATDSPVRALIRAHDDETLSTDDLRSTVVILLLTGGDALVAPPRSGHLHPFRHPHQLQQCRHRPDLWPRAVEEVLRYHHNGVLGPPRLATQDVVLHGVTIRQGHGVCTPALGATWDPAHYPDPAVFDIHRTTDGSATFGAGPHYCLGAALARRILHTAFTALFHRLPTVELAVPAAEVRWDHASSFTKPTALPIRW